MGRYYVLYKKIKNMNLKILLYGTLLILSLQSFVQDNIKEISATDFYIMINKYDDCVILDASPLKYYNKYRILGAISVAKTEMIKQALEGVDRDLTVMVYCKYGERSKATVPKIKAMGFRKVFEMKGGIQEWKDMEYPLDKSRKNIK